MARPKQVVLSLRYIEEPALKKFSWHTAVLVDGQMDRVFTGDTLEVSLKYAGEYLSALEFPHGTRIVARFDISEPGDTPEGA